MKTEFIMPKKRRKSTFARKSKSSKRGEKYRASQDQDKFHMKEAKRLQTFRQNMSPKSKENNRKANNEAQKQRRAKMNEETHDNVCAKDNDRHGIKRQNESTEVVENNYSSDEGSPIPPPRPYNLSRKKIDFTMEDLQNDVEDENGGKSFEGQALPSTSSMKCQPKRNCKIKQNFVVNQETETPKDGSDCDKSIGEEQEKSSSESDSDRYDYPEDNSFVVQYCSSPETPFSSREQ